jgi:two-component SAPR family response regulator
MRVIVIDDESDVSILYKIKLKKVIEDHNLTYTFFDDPTKALDFFKENNELSNTIVFSDINMPVLNGVDLFAEFTKLGHKCAYYFVSAYELETYKDELDGLDPTGAISKPIDFQVIIDIVNKYFSKP